ncbi:MAG: CBS domain-containing protein [Planctomycetota bacterium]|jgi:CBS domain-containing protein|nr:CBS domain-containing protein [Planctomycetota bacterium]MDP6988060.1 CBS domain-containing protein [Planctomycetota bacterium]
MILVRHVIESRPPALVLEADSSAAEAALFLKEHRIGGAPVLAGGELVGFCSERDIVFRVVAAERDPREVRVSQIMSTDVITATPDDKVSECEARMRERHVRHMPVLDAGKVVACVSLRDFLQAELRESKSEVRSLEGFIRGS